MVTKALKDTQETLLGQESEAAKKAAARLIQNLYNVPKKDAMQIAEWEVKYSRQYDIPLHIGLAITAKESGFNCYQVSSNGSSFGCKQINCFWWCKKFNTTKNELLTDREKNIEFGYKVLAENIARTGSLKAGLAAYLGTGDPVQDQQYAANILEKSKKFEV